MREISKNPTFAAVAGASVSAIVAIVIALMQPDPQVPLNSGESLSIQQTVEKIELLSRENEQCKVRATDLQERIEQMTVANAKLESDQKTMVDRLIRCGGQLPVPPIPTVTLSNGIVVTLGRVSKTGSVVNIDFRVHNPGREIRMNFGYSEVWYNGESHRQKSGKLGNIKIGNYQQIPSDHSFKGQVQFDVPASLENIEILRLNFLHSGWKFAEFRNLQL